MGHRGIAHDGAPESALTLGRPADARRRLAEPFDVLLQRCQALAHQVNAAALGTA